MNCAIRDDDKKTVSNLPWEELSKPNFAKCIALERYKIDLVYVAEPQSSWCCIIDETSHLVVLWTRREACKRLRMRSNTIFTKPMQHEWKYFMEQWNSNFAFARLNENGKYLHFLAFSLIVNKAGFNRFGLDWWVRWIDGFWWIKRSGLLNCLEFELTDLWVGS